MPTSPFSLLFLILSFTLLLPLTSTATTNNRRTLHEPFFPSSPPSAPLAPPSPTSPKYPFASTNTPTAPPFFPSVPSPPSPGSFASFPANISSLILPHAPSSSQKPLSSTLVAVAAALTASAAVITAVSVLLYLRRRRHHNNSNDKSSLSDDASNANSLRVVGRLLPKQHTRSPPPYRNNNSGSSEFLYLGNIATSRGGGGAVGDAVDGDASLRKLDSPELRPLPPLRQQSNNSSKQQDLVNAAAASPDDEEEEEEFYSPRGSSGGRESSVETGSASVGQFAAAAAAVAAENSHVVTFRNVSSNSSMYSSSNSGSPASTSSPPASFSPIGSRPKSPVTAQSNVSESSLSVSPPSSSSPSPDRGSEKSLVSSPGITYDVVVLDAAARISPVRNKVNSPSPSPSTSSLSSSPERPAERNHDGFLARMLSVSNQSVVSPVKTRSEDVEKNPPGIPLLSLSSPERDSEKTRDLSPRVFNVSVVRSSTFGLDAFGSKKNSRPPSVSSSSPRISSVSNRNVSPARSSGTAVLDQFAGSKKNSRSPSVSSSPRISNASNPYVESPVRSRRTSFDQLSNKKSSRSPSLSSLSLSSPERATGVSNVANPNVECGSSNVLANGNSRSPLVSSLTSSPESRLEKTQDFWSGVSRVLNTTVGSPARLGSAIPPELPRPRRHWEIPVSPDSSSPLEKSHDSSPRLSNVVNQNLEELPKHSRSSSRSSLSSPQRPLEKIQESSARTSNISNPNEGSPARTGKFTPPPPPPPPPPLPPLAPSRRQWEVPVSTTHSVPPLVLKPPVLVTASRPVNIPAPTLTSPIKLPPDSENAEEDEETEKPKLKPLHWDKVRASSDREMVWDHLNSSSFRLNEEMIETLFVVSKPSSNHKEATRRYVLPSPSQENRVLDPKKAQNIAIALRALNVTIEEVCEALSEGNVDALGTELLESLLKMAPTKEEEYRLREYKDDSPFKLGPAEKFLKAVLDIPCAFKRADAMLYIANFESEVDYLKKSFETLEAACEELRSSRMFLKLLEAVLKTGNCMNVGTNRGDAHAFKLDTLLKLVDVKGTDGETTLFHFVVQEIIRSEGARLSSGDQNPSSSINDDAKCRKLGLQVVSALSSELKNVKKSAAMDSDVLSGDVQKLSKGLRNIAETVRLMEGMGSEESIRKFSESMKRFVSMAEEEIFRIQAQESVALSLVKEITEYFHGNSTKEEAHPFRIFTVVRDFLTILDRVCKEVGMINERTIVSSAHKFPVPVNPMMQPLIRGFQGRRQYSFSDDESSSP